jgi:hypothetical protein
MQASRRAPRPPGVYTCSPVLLLIVARVLWTARPPARPVLGAEATMAEPAGPMTFRCPLAVRSTSHPPVARQRRSPWPPWSANVSELLASSAPYQLPQRPEDTLTVVIVDSAPSARKAPRHRAAPPERHRGAAGTAGGSSRSVRAGSVSQRPRRAAAITNGHQRFRGTAGHCPSGSGSWWGQRASAAVSRPWGSRDRLVRSARSAWRRSGRLVRWPASR